MAFITSIVLARLLSPSDFGLMAMIWVVIGFAEVFADLGISSAIVQRKEVSPNLLSSLFWFNVLFGLFSMAAIFLAAPYAADFYREPRVVPLMQWLSVSFLLNGLAGMQKSLMQRECAFEQSAKIEIFSTVLAAAVGIGSAYLGHGVWSLVYQSLSFSITGCILVWLVNTWRPGLIFKWVEVRSVMNYSMNLTGFAIFNFFARNVDNILIGRYLGAQDLGFYDLAYRLLLYPLQAVSNVVGQVLFPIYAQIQDDNEKFRLAYLKVSASIALVTFPIMLGLAAVSTPFVLVFFGDKWLPAATLIMILAPVGALQSIIMTVGTIYQVKNRTDILLKWGIVSGVSFTLAFIASVHWGVIAVAATYSLTTLILAYPAMAIPFRLIDLTVSKLISAIKLPLIATAIMVFSVVLVRLSLPAAIEGTYELAILVSVGAATYILANWMINRAQLRELAGILGVRI